MLRGTPGGGVAVAVVVLPALNSEQKFLRGSETRLKSVGRNSGEPRGDTVTNAEIILAFATFFGPIAAIQAERFLARRREKQERRLAIFRALMATRASQLTAEHVNAINAIPIDFYGHKKVTDRWEEYFAHLHKENMEVKLWAQKKAELLTALLSEIGTALKYRFNAREMESVYSPKGHIEIENAQYTILHGMAELLRGKNPLQMEVTNLSGPNEELNAALLRVLKGEQPLIMRREKDD